MSNCMSNDFVLYLTCIVSLWFFLAACSKSEPIDKSNLPILGNVDPDAPEIKGIGNLGAGMGVGSYVKIYMTGLSSCEDKPEGNQWFCKANLGAKTGISVHEQYWPMLNELRQSGEPFMLYGFFSTEPAPVIWVTQNPPSHLREYVK